MTVQPQGQLALKDIATLAGVSRPAVSNWKSRYATFPQPVENSPARRPLFEFGEVLTWLENEGLLPEDWQANATELIIASAVNPLAIGSGDPAAAALLTLSILAAHKRSHIDLAVEWGILTTAGNKEVFLSSLKTVLFQLSPDLVTSGDIALILESAESVPLSVLGTLVAGLCQVGDDNYATGARRIITIFFGSGGRSAYSHFSTSSSVASQLLANAAATTLSAGNTVFDPTCGIGSTLLGTNDHAVDAIVIGNDIDPTAATIASLQAFLIGANASFTHVDLLLEDPHVQLRADTIVCEPPFGVRPSKKTMATINARLQADLGITVAGSLTADAAFLTYPLHHLAPNGRAYLLTPLAVASQDRFAELRQNLVARNVVEAVIQLPRRLLSYTSISTALWVLRDPNEPIHSGSVLLADASESSHAEDKIGQWLTAMREGRETTIPTGSVTLAEMITQNNSLHPSLLLAPTPDNEDVQAQYYESWMQLKDSAQRLRDALDLDSIPAVNIPDISGTISLSDVDSLTRIHTRYSRDYEMSDETMPARLVSIRDSDKPEEEVFTKASAPTLKAGDILIPRFTTDPARIFAETEGRWVAPMDTYVLRLTRGDFIPEYLVACINASFNEVNDGEVLSRRKFSYIQIPLLDLEEQKKVVNVIRYLQEVATAGAQLQKQAEEATKATLEAVRYGGSTL